MHFIKTREIIGAPIKEGDGAEPYYATVDKKKHTEPCYATVDKKSDWEPHYATVGKNGPERYYATIDKMNGRPLEEEQEETSLN